MIFFNKKFNLFSVTSNSSIINFNENDWLRYAWPIPLQPVLSFIAQSYVLHSTQSIVIRWIKHIYKKKTNVPEIENAIVGKLFSQRNQQIQAIVKFCIFIKAYI